MATIKDVAKMAGVSIATVSNYINQTKPVSKELSWTIQEAIDTLHYQQNLNAKSLKSNTGTDIGVILPDLKDPYYVQIFQGINNHFMNSPYFLNVEFSRDIPEFEQNIADSFSRKKVSGLIMVSCRPEKWKYYYNNFTSSNIPVVLIDRTIEDLDANFVSFDNRSLMRDMTDHLLRAGMHNLVLFSGPERFRCEAECRQGFAEAMDAFGRERSAETMEASGGEQPAKETDGYGGKEPGMGKVFRNTKEQRHEVQDRYVVTDMSKEDAFRKTIALLKEQVPQAVVATSESLAEGIMEGIHILGYSTRNIPVFTLSEDHWNLYTHSLTSGFSRRRAIELGRTAAHLLDRQMQAPLTRENETIILTDPPEQSSFHWNRSFTSLRLDDISADEKRAEENPVDKIPATGISGDEVPEAGLSAERQFADVPANDESDAVRKAEHFVGTSARRPIIRLLLLDTPQVDATMGLVKNFTDRTGILVDARVLPHHLLYEEILRSYREEDGGPATDIFMYDLPWLPSLASEGILENITGEVEQLNEQYFLPGAIHDYGRFGESCYGIPYMYAPQILYYRKDLFEDAALQKQYAGRYRISLRPPRTLKEFNTVAEFFTLHTDAVPYSVTIPTAYSECLTPEIYMRLRAYGARLFDHAGNVCLDSPQALAAYINFAGILKYARPDYRTATDSSAVQDFLSGETSMLISYPSFLADVTDLRKSSIIGSIGYSRIPGGAPLLGGWGLGINSRSENRQEALEFIKWTCDEQIANYSVLLGGLPATAGAYQNDELTELYPWLPLYREVYQSCAPTVPPTLPNHRVVPQYETDKIVCNWINRMLDDGLEVQDTVRGTHADLEALTRKYKNAG